MVKALLAIFIFALLFVAARWFLPIGPARAIGADTLEVGRQRIALYGIELAPEGQLCGGISCAGLAQQSLAGLADDRYVFCLPYDRDDSGLFRGICWNGTSEINEAMVRDGVAIASPAHGAPYADAERSARERGRGVWGENRTATTPPVGAPARVPLQRSPI